MKYLKPIAFTLVFGALFTSCTKEEDSFNYNEMIGLWKMDEIILQGVSIQMDPCQEKTLLSITDSSIVKISYSGLTCDDIEYTKSKYKMPSTAYYLNIPMPGDTTKVNIDKITKDEFVIEHPSSDYTNPDIIELYSFKKIEDYPLPVIEDQ